MEALVKFVQDEFVAKKEFAKFGAGDTITVYYEIKEGEKVPDIFLIVNVSEAAIPLLWITTPLKN